MTYILYLMILRVKDCETIVYAGRQKGSENTKTLNDIINYIKNMDKYNAPTIECIIALKT